VAELFDSWPPQLAAVIKATQTAMAAVILVRDFVVPGIYWSPTLINVIRAVLPMLPSSTVNLSVRAASRLKVHSRTIWSVHSYSPTDRDDEITVHPVGSIDVGGGRFTSVDSLSRVRKLN